MSHGGERGPVPEGRRGHRGPPPWWPQGQPWPPRDPEARRRYGRRIARRVGCLVLLVLLVLGGLGTALIWLLLSAVGVVGSAPFARTVSGVALLAGLLAVLVSTRAVRRLATPAQRLVDAAQRVEGGDYSARVPERGPRELRSLARAFNAMSSRLEAEEARRRSVLADVAHELRTPLTIIRGQAEGIADGVYPASADQVAPILAATGTLESLVDDLRTLALAEAGGLHLDRAPLDVGVLVDDTVETFASSAAAAGIRLTGEVAGGLPAVDGDGARLRRALANLVSNALRHTARGGTVEVRAERIVDGVRLSVRDNGVGVPADLLPRVFERFVKGAGSTGSGLGLAITRDIVEAHGGRVGMESAEGAGTTVHLDLPE